MGHWTEELPSEDFNRVLAPDGTPEGDVPELDREMLNHIYRTFVLTRTFERKAIKMQRRGEISIAAGSRGEEATPIGSAAALTSGDWCFPTYRQTAALVYWNARLDRTVASLMGAEPETVDEYLPVEEPPAVNFSPAYVPLAVNVTNAVGSAMADVFNDRNIVTMAYIGDGSTSEGDFHEALNFAGVFEVPCVVICQNNQWAISVPAHRQTAAETFAQKAKAHGVPHERVDGNDVFAVYETTRNAVEQARNGDGPTFIECVTHRMRDHNTADAASVYRSDEYSEYWEERDPLDRFDAYLREQGLLDDERSAAIERAANEQVEEAVAAAREIPPSEPQRMFDHHLHGTSWIERHQRAEQEREQTGKNPFVDWDGRGFE